MSSRRKFISLSALGTIAAIGNTSSLSCADSNSNSGIPADHAPQSKPLFISTWEFGKKANAKALDVLLKGGSVLDAVEQGVKVIEADEKNTSVGIGGLPDREGRVTLDACIMDSNGMCGSVCSIENIKHPISVARMVMEKTPHVILVGDGALQFALENGMEEENLLTENSKSEWEKWKVESKYEPIINIENHDTIGMIGMDAEGNMAGACTTSGLAYKMRGRVGDSPIIGAGLFVDNEIGAAAATGLGEAVLRTLGSFLVVELMRQGNTPNEACKMAVQRIIEKHPGYNDFQVGFIAMNKAGVVGSYSIHQGFSFAKNNQEGLEIISSEFVVAKPK